MSNLGDYFKSKEIQYRTTLPAKGWYVIRVDGKAFSTYTQGLTKPFDSRLTDAMIATAKAMCAKIQNVKMAYYQSDEISLILSDLDSDQTSLWFDGQVQKMVSVAASIATANFNFNFKHANGELGLFDGRIFKLDSEDDVLKYLAWRQSDAVKNSITMISLKHFSHKQIDKKHSGDKIEMIKSKGDDLANYHQGVVQGFLLKKQIRRVPCMNPKTNQSTFADRTFWVEDVSPKFSQIDSLKDYYSFREKK